VYAIITENHYGAGALTHPIRKLTISAVFALATCAPVSGALAAEATSTDREFIELQTSINAIMVAMVDWSVHEIWEAAFAETLTERNWLTARQYATELLAAGTLVSLGGTGRSDRDWVEDPAWQEWSTKLISGAENALRAIDAKDQSALLKAGQGLVETCEGCHAVFKPGIPTEGIKHLPHHEYGDPLARD
jgi:cytochrome c556